jgi:tetratricopeptide (TPR) repeat protein
MKKDSADGRLLIWRCSWEMIKDQPLLGYGHGGFKAHYMDYQASYFEKNPESEYAMLADNVKYPFNEYLLLLTNYGFAGFILFLGFVGFMGYSFYRIRYKSIIIWISAWCLLSIAVFSFFSYPLIYPFVWIIGILSIIVIIRQAKYRIDISTKLIFSLKIIAVLVLILLLKETYQNVSAEMLWNNIAKNSLKGKTEQMLPIYEQLHKLLAGNEMFLYNYAAELNVVKEYDKSLQIAHECEKYLADYDLQMLIADNYQQLKQYKKAEVYYLKAANMCPVRFVPLYELEELYNTQGLNAEALSLARKIIKKPVKILSPTVIAIKQKMRQLIVEKEKTAVPETESRTSDQSKTTMPWSGRVPEIVSPDTTRPP